jgi:glycosyltransferase involved in cell wall biosynthesis
MPEPYQGDLLPGRDRVLSVITRLGRGGSERRLYDVLAAVPAEHTVVIGGDSDPDVAAALAATCEVLRCEPLVREVAPADDARALAHLVRLMRRRRFDAVHTHQSKAGLLGRVAARAAGVGVVYHSSSMASFGPGYGRAESAAFALAERATAPLVTRFFVVGDDLAGRMRANGVAPRRIEVVRSSLDLAPFARPDHTADRAGEADRGARAAARRRLGVDPDARVVVFVGSLDERKNVMLLPDAVGAASSGPVTLLIAGAGPLAGRLRREAKARTDGVDIRLLGHVGDVALVMRAADVLALPSSAEGLPQVLVQAARSGLPFVSFDVDGVAELLALGATGRSVPLGDRDGFVTALRDELAVAERGGRARRGGPDPTVWDQWDAATVAGQYRRSYRLDLGLGQDGPDRIGDGAQR